MLILPCPPHIHGITAERRAQTEIGRVVVAIIVGLHQGCGIHKLHALDIHCAYRDFPELDAKHTATTSDCLP